MSRAPLTCSHRPPCPGCPRFAESGVDGSAFSAVARLADRAGIGRPLVQEGSRIGFRHRARLSVRGRSGNPKIGIFEAGTHRLVHIPNCVVHHPLVNEVAREVRRCLAELRVAPYSDQAHLGTVRALQLAVERSSQTVQLVVVTRDTHLPPLDPLFAAISERIGNKLHSLWWNANPERTNTLLGPDFVKLSGEDSIVERFEGIAVHYPPGAFGQSNLHLFERLARRVGTFVPDGSRVLEFYGGTGALSLPLAHRLDSVVINEISTGSLQGLRLGVAGLTENDAEKVCVLAGPAAAFAREVERADVVLADPPRKGLDPELLDALLRTPPARFVYVSCGLASFLDQTERLLDSGKFALTALELFALFPFTEHVETLAVFDRRQ